MKLLTLFAAVVCVHSAVSIPDAECIGSHCDAERRAAYGRCSAGDDSCQELNEINPSVQLSGLWALDPNSLVYDGHPTPLESNLGFVHMDGDKGKYVLGNDIEFDLKNTSDGHLSVSITGETIASAEGNVSIVEELIRAIFLHDGNSISIQPVNRHRVVVSSSRGSVTMVPLPRIAESLLPSPMELDGEWISAVATGDNSTLPVRLSVMHTGSRSALLSLEGLNSHRLHLIIEDDMLPDNTRSVSVGTAYSTSLVPDNPHEGEVEAHLVQLLELSDRVRVVRDNSQPTLQMWNQGRPDIRASFSRPKFASRFSLFREIPASYWKWLPSTAEGWSLPTGAESEDVVLQVRHSTDATVVLDVFADSGTHLRAILLQTAQPGAEPLRTVQHISHGERPDLAAALLGLLESAQSLDVDGTGQYLSLVAGDKSLLLESVAYPSAGVWVLDERNSSVNGERVAADAQMAHRIRLQVEQRSAGSVHASVTGGGRETRVNFVVRNVAEWPSRQDLRIAGVSRREVMFDEGHDGPSEIDAVVEDFFHEGAMVQVRRESDRLLLRFVNGRGDVLVFHHSSELTAALGGHWARMPKQEDYLKLVPAGVGELRGNLLLSTGEHLKLRLREATASTPAASAGNSKSDAPNSTDGRGSGEAQLRVSAGYTGEAASIFLTPTRWNLKAVPVPTPKSPALRSALQRLGERIPERDPAGFNEVFTLKLHSKNVLETRKERTEESFMWVRTLPPGMQRMIEGDWFAEFAAVGSPLTSDKSNNSTAVPVSVAAAKADASARLLVTLERREVEDAENSMDSRSLALYRGKIMEIPSRRLLQKFTLEINPFAVGRVRDLVDVTEPATPEAVQPELEMRVAEFIAAAANPKPESPLRVEASPAELVLSDGVSVLVLSRGVPSKPVTMPLLILWEGGHNAMPPSPEAGGDIIVYAQQLRAASPQRRRLLAGDASANVDPLAMRMMKNYRRRLIAATNLDDYLRENDKCTEL